MFVVVKDLAAAIDVAKTSLAEFDALKINLKASTKGHVDDSVVTLAKLEEDHAKMLANRRHLQTAYEELQ